MKGRCSSDSDALQHPRIKGVTSDQSNDQVRHEFDVESPTTVVVVLLQRNACGKLASHRVKFIDPAIVGLPLRPPVDKRVELPLRQFVDPRLMVRSAVKLCVTIFGRAHVCLAPHKG